jgi:hypothetical protein
MGVFEVNSMQEFDDLTFEDEDEEWDDEEEETPEDDKEEEFDW